MPGKTGIASISEGRSDIHKIAPTNLHIREGWNTREWNFDPNDETDLALAKSIAEVGVKEPLTVYWEGEKAWIEDGHRRISAVWYAISNLKADIKTVPVKTGDRYANEADRIASQLIRNSGKPLTPMEQAKVYKKLLDHGWQNKEIAAKVGVTPSAITQKLELLTLPEELKSLVQAGTVSASFALQKVREEGGTKATETLTEAVATAKAEGKSKAMPKHVVKEPEAKPEPVTPSVPWTTPAPNLNKPENREPVIIDPIKHTKTVLKDAFDLSEVDNSDEDGSGLVVIRMPIAEFEKVRKILGL